jgi:hypothetical protein
MLNIDLMQMQQYYETLVTLRGDHDFRSRVNTAMWLDLDHMTREEHIREIWE